MCEVVVRGQKGVLCGVTGAERCKGEDNMDREQRRNFVNSTTSGMNI